MKVMEEPSRSTIKRFVHPGIAFVNHWSTLFSWNNNFFVSLNHIIGV